MKTKPKKTDIHFDAETLVSRVEAFAMHTTAQPVTGTEARRVLRLLDMGRAVTNPRAKAFAAEIVADLKGTARSTRKRGKAAGGQAELF